MGFPYEREQELPRVCRHRGYRMPATTGKPKRPALQALVLPFDMDAD
jgi:hypothetical protein